MVGVKDRISGGGVEGAHIFQPNRALITHPDVDAVVRHIFHTAAAWPRGIALPVWRPEKAFLTGVVAHKNAIQSVIVLTQLLLARAVFYIWVVDAGGGIRTPMERVPLGAYKRIVVGFEDPGNGGGVVVIVVPEGKGEGIVIAEELGEDALVEVEVPAMEGEEEPAFMDLQEDGGRVELVVGGVAVGAVDVGLVGEGAGVIGGKGLHEGVGAREVGGVGGGSFVGGAADAQRRGGRGAKEAGFVGGGGRAAVE
ncbi:hypothetical protein GOP47_0024086 [Adiantum capillus-veneris]|uniref:Uncharacterized protein n=1 Tax=Adiantum capillus-veneris TaxID=13818 RepID=A0A9D4U4S3_ADICA|nr:hypothetical protein GOP47_0024086 [Adiantum capillus-veneris]